MTAIPKEEDERLLEKWKSTDVWPIVREHASSISGSNWKSKHFTNFCPEVSYDMFHLFASMLCTFIDEIDKDTIQAWLKENGRAYDKDWRWTWAHVDPLHYSRCALYSQLPVSEKPGEQKESRKKDDIVTVKPGFFGVSIDVKKLLSLFSKWWLSKHE